jgi:hypothetical protein
VKGNFRLAIKGICSYYTNNTHMSRLWYEIIFQHSFMGDNREWSKLDI